MFTGIVEELGTVVSISKLHEATTLEVAVQKVADDVTHGASIAINGVCLTVTGWEALGAQTHLRFDVMKESLDVSSLGFLKAGDAVNLERAATMQTRLGGHLVQGHVDGVATILKREPSEHWEVVTVTLPTELAKYVVTKGSITVDGVSLTVTRVSDEDFSVSLIPTTLSDTTLGSRAVGEPVNLEVDIIAKHLERLLEARSGHQ